MKNRFPPYPGYAQRWPHTWHMRPDVVTRTGVIEPFWTRVVSPVTVARHTIDPFVASVRPWGPAVAPTPSPRQVANAAIKVAENFKRGKGATVKVGMEKVAVRPGGAPPPGMAGQIQKAAEKIAADKSVAIRVGPQAVMVRDHRGRKVTTPIGVTGGKIIPPTPRAFEEAARARAVIPGVAVTPPGRIVREHRAAPTAAAPTTRVQAVRPTPFAIQPAARPTTRVPAKPSWWQQLKTRLAQRKTTRVPAVRAPVVAQQRAVVVRDHRAVVGPTAPPTSQRALIAQEKRGQKVRTPITQRWSPWTKFGKYGRKQTYAEKNYERQTVQASMMKPLVPGPSAWVQKASQIPITDAKARAAMALKSIPTAARTQHSVSTDFVKKFW